MPAKPHFAAFLLTAALVGCDLLSAEHRLFSVADQTGPPPISEGVWIAISEECPERFARSRGRYPAECSPMDVRRSRDGSWVASFRADLATGLTAEERANTPEPYRLIIAPAVERTIPAESFAPLYVAELMATSDEAEQREGISYLVIAPLGAMPATSFLLLAPSCRSILRDGPIDGVTPRYTTRTDPDGSEHQELQSCIAENQDAVREAARRAVLENIEELTRARYVRVRP